MKCNQSAKVYLFGTRNAMYIVHVNTEIFGGMRHYSNTVVGPGILF